MTSKNLRLPLKSRGETDTQYRIEIKIDAQYKIEIKKRYAILWGSYTSAYSNTVGNIVLNATRNPDTK